jgi:hypothetical protein
LADGALHTCSSCDDGEVCIQRDADQLVCVSPHVCEALWDIGVRGVCRYADKRTYDHQPLPLAPGGCPGAANKHVICGGGCGLCGVGDRCVGRSPDHPFGICTNSSAPSLAEFAPCSITEAGMAEWCDPFHAQDRSWACAVFRVPDADRKAALRYGTCVYRDSCRLAAAALPGGVSCFDENAMAL